jgi:RNA polymerase sigma-32 factor
MESVDQYAREISRYSLLSREEEVKLARKVRRGDFQARQQMINSNLRFVVKIAHQYKGYGIYLIDLIQEGNLGMMRAVSKFDHRKGYRFVSYAVWWIRAFIRNYIIRTYSLVKIGTKPAQRTLFFKMRSTRNSMTVGAQEPTVEELAKKLSVRGQDVREMDLRLAARDFSVDSELYDGSKQTHLDMMEDDSEPQDEAYSREEKDMLVRTELWRIMSSFNERERYIIINRLMKDESSTLKEIGSKFSISRERARQIEGSVLRKLRVAFGATDLRPAA